MSSSNNNWYVQYTYFMPDFQKVVSLGAPSSGPESSVLFHLRKLMQIDAQANE